MTTLLLPLAPDPVLPQRDALLDPATVAERLAAGSAERVRTTYRAGRSLRVVYRLRTHGEERLVSGRAFAEGCGAAAYRRAVGAAAYDPELETVFWTFPADRKIVQLRQLVASPEVLSAALGHAVARLELVGYAPEKSATLRCVGAGGETLAYAKVYAGDDGARVACVHDELARRTSKLRLPAALAYAAEERTLVLEAIDGQPLSRVRGRDAGDAVFRLGAAIAELHELPPPPLAPFERHGAGRLAAAADTIAAARPDCAGPARALASAVAEGEADEAELVCLHGDVHPKNGIRSDGAVALVDLDDVGLGPAAADLGSMLAGLRYRRLTGTAGAAGARELAERFLAGYATVRPLPADEALRRHTAAAALGERALRAVTRVRPDGLAALPAVLGDAHDLFAGRGTLP